MLTICSPSYGHFLLIIVAIAGEGWEGTAFFAWATCVPNSSARQGNSSVERFQKLKASEGNSDIKIRMLS